jgi:hypothetical protein
MPVKLTQGVNFNNILCAIHSAIFLVPKNFKPKTELCNFWCQNFVQKMRAKNIDVIDPRVQFYKTFSEKHKFARTYMY